MEYFCGLELKDLDEKLIIICLKIDLVKLEFEEIIVVILKEKDKIFIVVLWEVILVLIVVKESVLILVDKV